MKLRLASLALLMTAPAGFAAQSLSNYQYVVSSQNPTAYFKLDGSLESAVNPSVVLEPNGLIPSNGGFRPDAYRNPTNAYYFEAAYNTPFLRNLTDPLISGGGTANSNATAKGSITFLFRSLSGPNVGGQRFLFDATTTGGMGTTNHNALALFFENDTSTNDPLCLKLRFGDSTTTILQASNLVPSVWYYFALTYDEARVPNKAIWYVGQAGTVLSTGLTANDGDAVAGEGTGLFVGQRADMSGAFRNPGSGRIDEFAIWARELSSLEISNQFAQLPPLPPAGATYQQMIEAQIPAYYFKLDNSLVESVGNTLTLRTNGSGGAFTSDFLGNPNQAYSFSETNDALYVTNDLINGGGPTQNTAAKGVGSISFLFRMLSGTNNSGQRFVFSAPAQEVTSTDDNTLALFLENSFSDTNNAASLKLRVGNTTKGNVGVTDPVPVAYAADLVTNAWYYFAMTYDETRNTPEVYLYFGRVGGPLTSTSFNPANSSVVGDDGWLVLGNKIEGGVILDNAFRSPGKGAIDEFAIWHDELTPTEIQAQFAALTPRPKLNITLDGGNVLLSWPASTPGAYGLEAAPALAGQAWTNAGSPAIVGADFVLTNALGSGASFFRLHKP